MTLLACTTLAACGGSTPAKSPTVEQKFDPASVPGNTTFHPPRHLHQPN